MKFSDVIKNLSDKITLLSTRISDDIQVFSTSLAGTDALPEDGVLYYTRGLCSLNNDNLHGSILWCGEKPDSILEFNFNYIHVSEKDFDAAVSAVNSILLHEYKSQSIHLRMMDILMNGRGITVLVNEMAKSLNTTIAVIDMSGKIIAQSTPFKITDPLWVESIERGFCPPFFIEHLRDVRTKNFVAQENHAILRHCLDTHINYLAKRIYISGELYGYVFLLQMTDVFSPYAEDVLNTIEQAVIEQHLKNKNIESVKTAFYDNLIIDIFRGISAEQIKARIYAGEMKFPQRMCLAAVKPRYFQGENYVSEKLSRILRQMFAKEHIVYYHKMMFILFALGPDTPGLGEDTLSMLQSLCTQEHLTVGISNPFSRVTSMNHYYVQAIKAIEIAGRLDLSGNIQEYKNIALYDLINNDAENHKVGYYCHPALSILTEYDNENGSQLHETLRSLAENGFNGSATASELFLHRNTLSYRKQKIVSLTGIDLDDFDTQFMLKYSFMIEKYLHKDSEVNVSL